MKKIVGILGMTAALASAAFALDVSASLKIEGSLMNVNEDGKFSALKTNTGTPSYAGLGFSATSDYAGASFNIGLKDVANLTMLDQNTDWGGKVTKTDVKAKIIDFTAVDGKIWVKPFANALNSALTLNVGKVGGLSAGKYGVGGDVGFLADYNNTDIGLNIAAVFNAPDYWFNGQTTEWQEGDKDKNKIIKDEAYVYKKGALDLFGLKVAYTNETIGTAAIALSYNDAASKTFQLALGYDSAEFVPGLKFGLDFYMQTRDDWRNRKAEDKDDYGHGRTYGVYNLMSGDGDKGCAYGNKMNIGIDASYTLADLGLTFSTAEELVFTQDFEEYYKFAKLAEGDSLANKLALNLLRTSLNVGYAKDLLAVNLGFKADFITASGDKMNKYLETAKIEGADKVINENITFKVAYNEPTFFNPFAEVIVENFLGEYGWFKVDGANNATFGEDTMAVKFNVGVSGKIGICDWTLGMNNTIKNYKANNPDASSKNPEGPNRGMKYSMDIPFTMSVAF